MFTDAEIEQLIEDYVTAATLAHRVGFDFVDVKACHGYLLHEFLSARTRPGRFGGDIEGRCRPLLSIIGRIRERLPNLQIGVRLSLFDFLPFQPGGDIGQPMPWPTGQPYLMRLAAGLTIRRNWI